MRYLLVTDGTWGDTLPFMFIAETLIQRGHTVTVISNAHYEKYAQEHHIPFIPSTSHEERREFLSHKDLWHPDKGMRVIAGYTGLMFEKVFPILKNEVEKGIDMIISHSFIYAAKTIAEIYNIPHTCVLISPIQIRSNYRLPIFYGGKNYNSIPYFIKKLLYPWIDRLILDPQFPKKINMTRKELGLKPITSFIQWTTQTDMSIGLWPSWYAPLEKDQIEKNLLAGFTRGVETISIENPLLSTWIKSGKKPIAVTMGSGYMFADTLLKTLKECSEQTGERFIFVGPQIQNPSISLESSVATLHQSPFSLLLPQCKLAIHHGGAGTLAQVIAAGIPHIIIPQSHDQPDNAYRIKENDLGEIIWNQEPAVAILSKTIEYVTNSEKIHNTCIEARKKFLAESKDGIERTCEYIENFSKELLKK